MAASRIIFAIARDGALPFSQWARKITPNGSPHNSVLVVYIFCAILLCVILPSAVAFTSLMSGGVVLLIAAYGLIALFRLVLTPNDFKNTKHPLGRARKLLYAISALFNGVLFAVRIPTRIKLRLRLKSFCRLLSLPSHFQYLPRHSILSVCFDFIKRNFG